MDVKTGIIAIVAVCAIVLVIGIIKNKVELLINFMLRGVVGIFAIYLLNQILASQQVAISVGVNPISVITVGTLGIPGIALLYGVVLTKLI